MEYSTFAKYYDIFYSNKDYKKEADFLTKLLDDKKIVLDAGCGTGVHMKHLEDNGYDVDGVDINTDMLVIASKKVKGDLYAQNLLDLNIPKKYEAIISMFAVLNHLDNNYQLYEVLTNFKKHLLKNGVIILDMHNPKCSGTKEDCIKDIKRIMAWEYDCKNNVEKSTITYEIDGVKTITRHRFKIFTIKEIEDACKAAGLKLMNCYENYTLVNGTKDSKNLQFYIMN